MPACVNCGANLADHMRFCPECGTAARSALSESPAEGPTLVVPPLPAPPAEGPTLVVPALPAAEESPAAVSSAPPAPSAVNWSFWAIIGGIGCLSLLLIGACAGLVILYLSVSSVSVGPLPLETSIPGAPFVPGLQAGEIATPGEVLLRDDFTNPRRSSLVTGEDAETHYRFGDGGYLIEVRAPQMIAWSYVDGRYADVAVEVEATLVAGPEPTASGLIFRYQDDDNFYLFNVANDGYYNLDILEDGAWRTLIDWTPSTAIARPGAPNVLRVEMVGARITLFVNGVMLDVASDATFPRGEVALAVNTFDNGKATIRFDNLVITSVE